MADDNEIDDTPSGPNPLAVALPIITAGVALLIGLGLGVLIGLVVMPKPEAPPPEIKMRDLTAVELEAACAPLIADAMTKLDQATEKVETLQSQVSIKEARVKELEEQWEKGKVYGAKVQAELKAARTELEDLRARLVVAEQEKEQLIEELKRKVEELETTKEVLAETKFELEVSKEDALNAKWKGFVQEAQLAICERGGRKKMGRCRETVAEQLGTDDQDKFRHCVKSGQAVPTVAEATKEMRKDGGGLPEFAEYLNEEEKITKDWYVLLCDPTLPEADGMMDDLLRREAEKAGGEDAVPGLPEDLDDLGLDGN